MQRQKPLVAALTGYTTGFGFELALACDLRVIEATAQIGLGGYPMEMSNWFHQRLISAVGLSHALDLALTGRNLTWREAQQCGLANRLVDCGTGEFFFGGDRQETVLRIIQTKVTTFFSLWQKVRKTASGVLADFRTCKASKSLAKQLQKLSICTMRLPTFERDLSPTSFLEKPRFLAYWALQVIQNSQIY